MGLKLGMFISSFWLSRRLRAVSPRTHGFCTKTVRRRAEVLYFHQPDDPYSQLTAQILTDLQARYDIDIKVMLVDAPSDDMAPERAALENYSRRDAAAIARFHGLQFTDPGQQPSSRA